MVETFLLIHNKDINDKSVVAGVVARTPSTIRLPEGEASAAALTCEETIDAPVMMQAALEGAQIDQPAKTAAAAKAAADRVASMLQKAAERRARLWEASAGRLLYSEITKAQGKTGLGRLELSATGPRGPTLYWKPESGNALSKIEQPLNTVKDHQVSKRDPANPKKTKKKDFLLYT